MGDRIIVGGREVECNAPVRLWTETKMHFLAPTRHETRFVTVHWTAAENAPERVYENLLKRKLSVHFICDQLGELYQCADADARLSHADRIGNSLGIGIEVINRGHGDAPSRSFTRAMRTATVHGRTFRYAAFYPAQVASVIELCRSLCSAYGLPMRVPMKNGEVYPTVLPAKYLKTYSGVLGHFQFDLTKVDPAPDILAEIHAAGLLSNV